MVSVDGQARRALGAHDYFGEIALIDGGVRAATVTAMTELKRFGLDTLDFR